MMKNYNDINHIEAWILGEMDAVDQQDFETQLASDEVLQQEVAAYRKIISGLKGIREDQFAADVRKWAAEAQSAGNTRPVNNGDQLLTVSRGAVIRRMYRRIAVAASMLLVLGMASVWWISRQYADEKLVTEAYVAPLNSGTLGVQEQQTGDLEKQFREAHRLFEAGDYGQAAPAFGTFIIGLENSPDAFDNLTRKAYLDNARWTSLLAKFAAGQIPEKQLMEELKTIADDPASDYAEKARELRKDMRSFWRVFVG